MAVEFLKTSSGRRIAYRKTSGDGPGIVFLGGFRSDMEGTKAAHLQAWAAVQGRAFLRFDYSGHGASTGGFEEGCIGDWVEDAAAAISELTEGPQVLVGSSMGGWIALLLARAVPDRIKGLVGIAAAPDFTEDGFWAGFSEAARAALIEDGSLNLPSDYGDPLVVTRHLIEDGRSHLVLRDPLSLPFPVRLLQGTDDADVTRETALNLLDHAQAPEMSLTFVKGADHRFSDAACLARIEAAILEVS